MKDKAFIAVSLTLGIARLCELRISGKNERMAGVAQREGAASSTYPIMVALNVALFTLPLFEPNKARPRRLIGGVLLLLATALRWWCIRTLGWRWNARSVIADHTDVVDSGPYRFVRHPNYLAVALEFVALPIFGGALRSAVVLFVANALVLWHRISAEEQGLRRLPGYTDRMSAKSRFIPGVL